MAGIAGFRARARGRAASITGFWRGVIAFWLVFGVLYALFAVSEETKVSSLTLGDVGHLVVLALLWPVDALGYSISF